jgi:hypothetical protein
MKGQLCGHVRWCLRKPYGEEPQNGGRCRLREPSQPAKIKIKILLQDPPWVIPVSDHVGRLCSGLDLVPASDAANHGLDSVVSGNPHQVKDSCQVSASSAFS